MRAVPMVPAPGAVHLLETHTEGRAISEACRETAVPEGSMSVYRVKTLPWTGIGDAPHAPTRGTGESRTYFAGTDKIALEYFRARVGSWSRNSADEA